MALDLTTKSAENAQEVSSKDFKPWKKRKNISIAKPQWEAQVAPRREKDSSAKELAKRVPLVHFSAFGRQ